MKRFLLLAAILLMLVSVTMAESNEVLPAGEGALSAAEEETELSFPAYINEDMLAESYISSMLPAASSRYVLKTFRPSGLIKFPAGTANRNLYLALRSEITGIADGTNDKQYDDDIGGMSTIFAIPAADIFPATSFTAADLGVDSLFADGGAVDQAAREAFWSEVEEMRASIAFSDVAMCIVNDSPYELYWFGRTARVLGNSFDMEVRPASGDGEEAKLVLVGSYRVLFSVNVDYAVPNQTTVIDGTAYRTWVDTDKFGSVERAKKKINEIKAAVSGMTDEQKLNYFATEICSLVSYNFEAEEKFKAGTMEYGDPWQLVWVFDNRSKQQVVCEGYSKAFAYLCELCTSEAETIIVWGSIPGGNHMWNVVKYRNHNYLVDLTNYDLGYDMFMVGADGSPAAGYDTKALRGYQYDRKQTKRTDEELTIAPYSYAEWKAATTTAPNVFISSATAYPGYLVAVRAESSNGVLPVDQIVITSGEENEIYDGDTAGIAIDEDREISVSAVMDGITTPVSASIQITVAEEPEAAFSLPAGARVEDEAFSGTAAELVQVNNGQIDPGAFDPDVILAVDEIGDWFESGYRFVVTNAMHNE